MIVRPGSQDAFSAVRRAIWSGAAVLMFALTVFSAETRAQEVDDAAAAERGRGVLAAQRRLVARFDFEETADFPARVPPQLYRVLSRESSRPDLPPFGEIAVDAAFAAEGDWSLRFDLQGGSMALALSPSVVAVFPQSRYIVSSMVRTDGLSRAGARLVARFHDARGEPIPDTEVASEPIRTSGGWERVSIALPTDIDGAADLVFELQIVQPSADAAAGRPRYEDIRGTAHFDAVEIWQLPRLGFRTDRPGHLARLPEVPHLEVSLRDLARDAIDAEVVVTDLDGRERARKPVPVRAGRGELRMPFPVAEPGWFRAELIVRDPTRIVVRRAIHVILLPERVDGPRRGAAPRFGFATGDWDARSIEPAIDIVRTLDPDFVLMPAWQPDLASSEILGRVEDTTRFVERLIDVDVEPLIGFTVAPWALAREARLVPRQVHDILRGDETLWRQWIEPWLLAIGESVDRWGIGGLSEHRGSDAVALDDRVLRLFERSVADPALLEVQWVDDHEPPPSRRSASVMTVPVDVRSDAVSEAIRAARGLSHAPERGVAPSARGAAGMVLLLRDDETGVNAFDGGEELGRRLIEAWGAGASDILIESPWLRSGVEPSLRTPDPTGLEPASVVLAVVTDHLRGRPCLGTVPMGRDVEALLAADGTLVLRSTHGPRTIDVALGAGPIRVSDVFGRTRIVERSGGRHRIELGDAPLFVKGADLGASLLRRSLAITPDPVEASIGLHEHVLRMEGGWRQAVRGTLAIVEPSDWTFTPRVRRVELQPGSVLEIPVEFSYPRTEGIGSSELVFSFTRDDDLDAPIDLRLPIDIESTELALDVEWSVARSVQGDPSGIILTLELRYDGEGEIDPEAFAIAPGYPQNRGPMPTLSAGETAFRTFPFVDGVTRLSGQTVLVGLATSDGRRVVKRITIPRL